MVPRPFVLFVERCNSLRNNILKPGRSLKHGHDKLSRVTHTPKHTLLQNDLAAPSDGTDDQSGRVARCLAEEHRRASYKRDPLREPF